MATVVWVLPPGRRVGDRSSLFCRVHCAGEGARAHAVVPTAMVAGCLRLVLALSAMWCGVVRSGVVWCGVVWCGVVWCGVVWCGVVWCGVVWCGVVWCGVVWCGVVWRSTEAVRCSGRERVWGLRVGCVMA